jgi:hypothetical protein
LFLPGGLHRKSVSENTKSVQTQFEVIFDLTQKVQQQEEVIKNAMDEQNAGNSLLLSCVAEMRDGTHAVEDAAYALQRDTEEIMGRISKIGQ